MTNKSPFGRDSRVRILKQHLAGFGTPTIESAWRFIYEELLWIDGSTGLAHLYESDKAQPGRPWYDRTSIFTDMLCEKFGGITHEELKPRIDLLFRACLQEAVKRQQEAVVDETTAESELADTLAGLQQTTYSSENTEVEAYIPDVSLVTEFASLLIQQTNMPRPQAELFAHDLVAKARHYFTVERKRQNVLGEGFEDLLQLLIEGISRVPPGYVVIRQRANKLPGFQNTQNTRERVEAPDIAIVRNGRTEILASVKWSLRHDRQKQLSDELDCYVDLLSQDEFPKYVLITNEYDPGRLVNTDGLNRRGQRIDHIYHVNLELLLGALQDHERSKDLIPLIDSGRLGSISGFLGDLSRRYGSVI